MEFDEVVVKESPGLCRCCLSEGCYKDLGSEYNWMGDTEIYADMLLECFDIGISQHAEGPNGPNRLICEVCITRLRDSCNFKKQVLDSEKRFIDMLHRGEFRSKAAELPVMKQEAEALEVEYLDDLDFGDDGDDQPKTDTEPEQAQAEDITVTTLPMKRGRGRPRKSAPEKPERRAKVAKVEQPKASKAPAKELEDEKVAWESLLRLRANLGALLRHTNVLPFRWGSHTFKCFVCPHKGFTESKSMRSHFSAEHAGFNSPNVIRQAIPALKQIRLDVTDLRCKLCSDTFDDLHKLTAHLIQKHSVKYFTGFERYLFQVKLDCARLKCFECGAEFDFFQQLVKHSVDEHEKSVFLCHVCGKGFEFADKLNAHRDVKHAAPIKCSHCEKTFTNFTNRKAHEVKEHKVGGYTCKECGLTFGSFHKRKLHAMAEHDQGNRYTCKECSLTFLYNKKLQQHLRTVHRKERKTCPICNIKVVFLQKHMICHSDEKPFVCEVCQKSFARKHNIVAHMKRHEKSAKSST